MLQLKFYKLYEHAILPKKAHSTIFEDAAYDLYFPGSGAVVLEPGEQYTFPTGLACIIPEGYWLKFNERSGLAAKKGIKVSAGVIDPGYTGHLQVILLNTSKSIQTIVGNSAICQFTIEKIIPCELSFIEKEEFETEVAKRSRQEAGFGSSDKKK